MVSDIIHDTNITFVLSVQNDKSGESRQSIHHFYQNLKHRQPTVLDIVGNSPSRNVDLQPHKNHVDSY